MAADMNLLVIGGGIINLWGGTCCYGKQRSRPLLLSTRKLTSGLGSTVRELQPHHAQK